MKRIFALLVCAGLLAGCAAADSPAAAQVSSVASSAAQSAASAVQPEYVQPLTGVQLEAPALRPAAVMVRNTPQSAVRQWGLSSADVVMEALTEGKSTNLMLWYSSLGSMPKVGPVAEGRDLFWQFALPENTIVVQKGSNVYAKNLLNCYAWQPLDALALGVNAFDFDGSDPAMADEDCWFTQGPSLQGSLANYGLSEEGTVPVWQQFGDQPATSAQTAAALHIAYSDQNGTFFNYENGAYTMLHPDASAYIDANNGASVCFQNVLVLYASAGVKDDRYTRDYDLTGGDGLYLVNGTWQTITWQKGDAASPLKLMTAGGTPLTLARGKTYVGIYGGFGGQTVSLVSAAGEPIETGLAAPAAIATPTEAPADSAAASVPDSAVAAQ